MRKRALLLVIDSVGIGNGPDAAQYFNKEHPDTGSNTLGHIHAACAAGKADQEGVRQGPLTLPHLSKLGFYHALEQASGYKAPEKSVSVEGAWGEAVETSKGKDTPSGHLEIVGVPVDFDWHYYPEAEPCFPAWLTDAMIKEANLPGVIGNKHASGTVIIQELGEQHLRDGKPIVYTSADSVIQIAAHEESFGLENLYRLCELTRQLVDQKGDRLGRVIARPFVGTCAEDFKRTGNRRDYATPPPGRTLLDAVLEKTGEVLAVGKISDIFAGVGVSHSFKAHGNEALFDATLSAFKKLKDQSLLFTNFVDFDQLYGHRRNVPGYAACLEAFDRRLPELLGVLEEGDLVIITADHGNDPSWVGTDHTREQVPILAFGPKIKSGPLGQCQTFADMGQTIADYLELDPLGAGTSFLDRLI